MATAAERHQVTESYLGEIKSRMGMCPMLEENDMKMLHMNAPLGDWREWRTLTYDHNLLADWLVRENEDLHKIKKDLEMKIRMLSPHFPHCPPPGYPDPCPCPNPLLINPGHHLRSAEVEKNEIDLAAEINQGHPFTSQ